MGAKTKQLKGRIKQAAGSLTGNKKLEREGKADRRSGQAQERLNDVTDKVEGVVDTAIGAVDEALGTGRRAQRRR